MSITRGMEIVVATLGEKEAGSEGWLVRHGETKRDAAIRTFRDILASTGLIDWTPVLAEPEPGRFVVEEASPDCWVWSGPDEDGEIDVVGFDVAKHPAAIAA